MNWLTRKFRLMQRCAALGNGPGEAVRLMLYQFRGAVSDRPADGKGHLCFKLRNRVNGATANCFLRKNKSDWIIFREIFFFNDYAEVSMFTFSPKVIYDIGANAGIAAVYLHLMFPNARIFGFEPGTPEFTCARENYKRNGFGEVFPIALGDKNELLPFFVNESASGGQGFGGPAGNHSKPEATVESRPVRRLENFAHETHLPPPDLIKMDIEGFEVKALHGMGDTLSAARGIVMETHGPQLHAEVLEILAGARYNVVADEHRFDLYRILLAERLEFPQV